MFWWRKDLSRAASLFAFSCSSAARCSSATFFVTNCADVERDSTRIAQPKEPEPMFFTSKMSAVYSSAVISG